MEILIMYFLGQSSRGVDPKSLDLFGGFCYWRVITTWAVTIAGEQ